jgi:hypothetical protein
MTTPYTTPAGVQIGILYAPKLRIDHSVDAVRLQVALVQKPSKPPTKLQQVVTRVLRLL